MVRFIKLLERQEDWSTEKDHWIQLHCFGTTHIHFHKDMPTLWRAKSVKTVKMTAGSKSLKRIANLMCCEAIVAKTVEKCSPTKMLRVRGHQAKRMLVMVLPNWGFGVSGNRQDILKLEMLYEHRVIQSSFINIVYFWISVKI